MHRHSTETKSAGPDLDLIFDLAPLALLILSPSWRITRASGRFLSGWRVSADNCVGQSFLPFIDSQLHPPRPSRLTLLTSSIDDAIAVRAERTTIPINTKHGCSWKARVIPVFNQDELVSIVLEWQEGPPVHVSGDELLKPGFSTDEAFHILVHALKDYAIFLLDTRGHIVSWNRGAEVLKGYKREDVIGKHFSIFYGKEDLDIGKPEMELEICLHEGRVEDEGWRYRRDGSRFWANVIITAIYKDGVHVGFGKVTRDLTERKSAESRLIAAYEESEKLKSDFLANMSHEIRTPMHGMLSACTLLFDTELTARQRDIVTIMEESGQVLLQVINDILDYSKLASGSFTIHSDIVGITSIVTSVVRSVQAALPASVHFELFLATDLPRSVQGDPLRYRQILQNIVGNAAKFTDKGSIRVRAAIENEDESSYTILTEVTDTGIGVPEDASANLFTPFTQFDATTTKQYKGTGLGLSIAKSLAELMGGGIGYRPNPDRRGSVFWFTARFNKIKRLGQMREWRTKSSSSSRQDDADTPVSDEIDALQTELRMASSTKNVLVVEDNVINQKVILGMLRSIGLKNVDLASNGSEAVKMVCGKPAAYDIVLMDISMPIMDGNAATKEIRSSGILVPIIAMTAYALKGDRERCLEHGMNDYVAKPVDKKHLIRVLGKWLLRMTDYRKTYDEQRLAELRRPRDVVVAGLHPASTTHGAEAKQFLYEVANGLGSLSAEARQITPPTTTPRRETFEKEADNDDKNNKDGNPEPPVVAEVPGLKEEFRLRLPSDKVATAAAAAAASPTTTTTTAAAAEAEAEAAAPTTATTSSSPTPSPPTTVLTTTSTTTDTAAETATSSEKWEEIEVANNPGKEKVEVKVSDPNVLGIDKGALPDVPGPPPADDKAVKGADQQNPQEQSLGGPSAVGRGWSILH